MERVFVWNEADVIRKLRAETGITTERLAIESRVSISAINRIETGRTADATKPTLEKLAAVFGMSYEDLIAAVPSRHPGVRVQLTDAQLARWREERKRSRRLRVASGTR